MAKEKSSKSSGANKKITFSSGSDRKRTSIGKSKNSRPKNKDAVRARKGR
jgi:hypothetical protein